MRKLNHNQLYYFHIVAEERGLAKGAKRLGMAQSTLSEQLRSLERSLETRLFNRTKSGLSLSEAGRAAFHYTDTMFKASTEMLDALCGERKDVETISIGVASTVSRSLAAHLFVPLFEGDQFRVRMLHGNHEYLLQEVLSAELDMLLSDMRAPTLKSKGIVDRVVQKPKMLAVASPQLAKTLTTFPNDLHDLPYIAYSLHSRYRAEIEQFFEDRNLTPRPLGAVDDVTIMLELVLQHRCFAVLPEPVVSPPLEEGKLEILGQVDNLQSEVYALYVDREPSEHILRVLDTLAQA